MSKNKAEKVSQKSAAEFFSEHQQIAGFDNAGKSLYTTIRELVENSLDASESIQVLPDIKVFIVEFNEEEHNMRHNIKHYDKKKKIETDDMIDNPTTATIKKKTTKATETPKQINYYDIICKDNGCGIPPDKIGDMLGRVLSGSKHGCRQTRGKFGLGAKMALIWSKKSSGLPITVRTAHSITPGVFSSKITTIVLDIDIHRNEPRIISRTEEANTERWRGCEIKVTISGAFSSYRSRVLMYFQQLAVITPYARLELDFKCSKDDKKNFTADFSSRSQQMPPLSKEIPPHPRSLDHINLSRMLKETKEGSLAKFLVKDLTGVSPLIAKQLVSAIGEEKTNMSSTKVTALRQSLRDEKNIKPPPSSCLSPAGEYNMRLGVLKELRPRLVATFTDKPGAHEGHPFLVGNTPF